MYFSRSLARQLFFISLFRTYVCVSVNVYTYDIYLALLSVRYFHTYKMKKCALIFKYRRYLVSDERYGATRQGEREREMKRGKKEKIPREETGSAAPRPHYAYECKFPFASLRAGIYLSRTRSRIQPWTVWNIRDSPSPRRASLTIPLPPRPPPRRPPFSHYPYSLSLPSPSNFRAT